MGLNIKNERVHELARRAAAVTGRTQTSAIELALERLLDEHGVDAKDVRAQHKIDTARAIVAAYATDAGETQREIVRVDDLFDASSGLPR